MTKEEYRSYYKNKRLQLSSETFEQNCALVTTKAIEHLRNLKPDVVHVFLPIVAKREVLTHAIIKYCWNNNITTVVPVSDFKTKTIRSAHYDETTKITVNKYQIPEPTEPNWLQKKEVDLVFTPLLAFDSTGMRLGYGGGFYDRFFAQIPHVKKTGLSLFEATEKTLPTEQFDFQLDYCITPQKLHSF